MRYAALAKVILDKGWVIGIRSTRPDEQYQVNDSCRESYEWDVEYDCSAYFTTGELAGGTCATEIDTWCFNSEDEVSELAVRIEEAIRFNYSYGSDEQVIIAGHRRHYDGMFDERETRIIDAFVIDIVSDLAIAA